MSTYTDIFGLYAVKQEDNILVLFLLWDSQKAAQSQKCGPLPEEQTDVVTAAEEEVHFGENNNRRLFFDHSLLQDFDTGCGSGLESGSMRELVDEH